MPKCFNCGSELCWGADFDNEDYDIEEEGIVSCYSCSECGAQYTVFVPFEKPKDVLLEKKAKVGEGEGEAEEAVHGVAREETR